MSNPWGCRSSNSARHCALERPNATRRRQVSQYPVQAMSRQYHGVQREQIQAWLKQDLSLAKIHMLLGPPRGGDAVPDDAPFRGGGAGFRPSAADGAVADGKPGKEVQVDFGRLGLSDVS